jgi:hypothetical protein
VTVASRRLLPRRRDGGQSASLTAATPDFGQDSWKTADELTEMLRRAGELLGGRGARLVDDLGA